MIGAFYAYGSALLVFALTAEARSPWLQWLGTAYGLWLVLAGSILGYRAGRDQD